jgi:DNA-binding MarR family transcriptional regulator
MIEQIHTLMSYVDKIRDNGELDIFTQLFQTDFRILTYLVGHQGAHPSIMADDLKVTRPNIAANLRLLEGKKMVVRVIDSNNRRQIYVNITQTGLDYVKQCEAQLGYLFAGWFNILGKDEVNHLLKILDLSSNPKVMTDDLKKFKFGK